MVEAPTAEEARSTAEELLTRTEQRQTNIVAQLAEIPWPRARTGRARTRVSVGAGSRQALATAVLAAETSVTLARELAI